MPVAGSVGNADGSDVMGGRVEDGRPATCRLLTETTPAAGEGHFFHSASVLLLSGRLAERAAGEVPGCPSGEFFEVDMYSEKGRKYDTMVGWDVPSLEVLDYEACGVSPEGLAERFIENIGYDTRGSDLFDEPIPLTPAAAPHPAVWDFEISLLFREDLREVCESVARDQFWFGKRCEVRG